MAHPVEPQVKAPLGPTLGGPSGDGDPEWDPTADRLPHEIVGGPVGVVPARLVLRLLPCLRGVRCAEEVGTIRRASGQQRRDRVLVPSWPAEEVDWPLCDSALPDMHESAGFRFVDVLLLDNQSERFFGALARLREVSCFCVGSEGVVVVAPFSEVRCSSLGVAPDSVLKHSVPDVATTSACSGWIAADERLVPNRRVLELSCHPGPFACVVRTAGRGEYTGNGPDRSY